MDNMATLGKLVTTLELRERCVKFGYSPDKLALLDRRIARLRSDLA